MPAGTTADTPEGSSRMGSSTLVLPDLPVKTPPVHEGQKIMTAVDAALNAAALLEVARGGSPPRNAALKDYPVHELGPIASMDPRLRLKRLEWERENARTRTLCVLLCTRRELIPLTKISTRTPAPQFVAHIGSPGYSYTVPGTRVPG